MIIAERLFYLYNLVSVDENCAQLVLEHRRRRSDILLLEFDFSFRFGEFFVMFLLSQEAVNQFNPMS